MPYGQQIAAADVPASSYKDWVSTGKALVEADDQSSARDAFLEALAIDGHQLEARQWLCRLAYKSGDWKDLHDLAGAYLIDSPNDREVLLLYARSCNGLADWSGAAEAWSDVCEDRPEWSEARFQHGRARLRLGDHSTASQIASDLESMPGAGSYVVRLRVELNEFSGARSALEALFRSDPEVAARDLELMGRQRDQRGLAVFMRARLDTQGEAAVDAEQILTVSEALFRRAIGFERAGDLLQAHFDYDALLVLAPDDDMARRSSVRIARALREIAQDHVKAQALPEAAQAFAVALRAAPADAGLFRNYGRILMRLRDWTRAVGVWREFARLQPDDVEGHVQVARALDRSGCYPEAVLAWRVVRDRDPGHDEAMEALSTVNQRMIVAGRLAITEERFLEAYDLFKTVLNEDPQNQEPGRRLQQVGRNLLKAMRAAYKASDPRRVLAFGVAATDLLPSDAEVQLLIGRAAGTLRRHEVGAAAWSRLAQIDPTQAPLAHLQIARCRLHLGDYHDALAATRKILVAEPKNVEARKLLERLRSLV
jgi:tetratricopeptide (TPR) repeat protein